MAAVAPPPSTDDGPAVTMAHEPSSLDPSAGRSSLDPASLDPASLDPTIEALLEQQASIQAKLAVLLPQKFGPNVKVELENLQHKLRILRAFAADYSILDRLPILSDIEEARQLQYQIECIETACLENGHNLHDPRVVDALRSLHHEDAPAGFDDWLRRNLSQYDPVVQAGKERDRLPADQDDYARRHGRDYWPLHSYKCPEENCLHYIYGFSHREDRDQHFRAHGAPTKRDSGLSVGGTPPPLLFADPARSRLPSHSIHLTSPVYPNSHLPQPNGGLQLPPLLRSGQSSEHRDSLRSYSLTSEHIPASRPPQAAPDSESDPLLPPLKRSRVGPSRLESIGELNLLQDAERCVRCRLLRKKCDTNEPCSSCYSIWADPEDGDTWKSFGCQRADVRSLVDILVPALLAPGRPYTPMTSPLAQRRNTNTFLENSFSLGIDAARVVQLNLDFDDGFWWTDDLAALPPSDPVQASFSREPVQHPPPVLTVFASSWNMGGTAYNFWQLLKLSGLLSATRAAEASDFPVLYLAKLLLREVLFFDLQQPSPSLARGMARSEQPAEVDDYECHGRYRVVCSCMAEFIRSLEAATVQRDTVSPRHWLAAFFALCIFSIIRSVLADMVSLPSREAPDTKAAAFASTSISALHTIYRDLVAMFACWLPIILDDYNSPMADEDRELYNTASMIIKKSAWAEHGIQSTKDFLLLLGLADLEPGLCHGFVRQRTPGRYAAAKVGADPLGSPHDRLPPYHHPSHSQNQPIVPPPGPQPSAVDAWASTRVLPLTDGAILASPQNTEVDTSLGRRHLAGSPTYVRSDGPVYTSPSAAPRTSRAPYQRPPLRRVYCNRCNEYPEGFRGEHELRRHTDAKHATLVKRWVCVEPTPRVRLDAPQPVVPLFKCKSCLAKKKYGAYYNAAAHLRRAHFNPHRGSKASGEWPPMTILKDWMQEVRLSFDVQDDPASSDGEEEGDYKMPDYTSPTQDNRSQAQDVSQPDVLSSPGVSQLSHPSHHLLAHAHPHRRPRPSTSASALTAQGHQVLLQPLQTGPEAMTPSSATYIPQKRQVLPQMPPIQIPPLHTPGKQSYPHVSSSPSQVQQLQPLSAGTAMASEKSSAVSAVSGMPGHLHTPRHPSPRQKATPSAAAGANARAEDSRPSNRNRCPHPECGRVFKDLAAHMLTHMEERPEKCPIESCEYHTKGFARKYDKNRHALTHYKGTMVCPFCHGVGTAFEKAFNRADVFKRHLTAVHNVEQTPPNSKKSTLSGIGRQVTSLADSSENGAVPARCSICRSQFLTAQEFYEHLDDCVLNVIVPSTPRSAGGVSIGTAAATSSSSTGPASANASSAMVAGATVAEVGSNSSKGSPTAKTPTTASTDRGEKLHEVLVDGTTGHMESSARHLLPGPRC